MNRRVLIVDDEFQVGSLICQVLTEHGYRCRVAASVDQAKPLIDAERPEVLITDIQMPGKTGLELLIYVRQRAPDCKVVLITGYSNREYLTQALLLGAHEYVEKPFELAQLVETVSRALGANADTSRLLDRAVEAMEQGIHESHASLDSVAALILAVEAKDPYTRAHSEQVAHYAVNLAKAVGMSSSQIESIRVASLLHDIGKIGVPDHILTKPGSLTAEEFEYISRHPALGSDILSNISVLADEARIVRHHHERWDGQGYPDGLAGEEIPVGARVIQIADCIDAMLMERTYKTGYSIGTMLDELCRCAGMQFDPRLALAASQWCRRNRDKLILPGKSLAKRAAYA